MTMPINVANLDVDETALPITPILSNRKLDLVLFAPDHHVTVLLPENFPGDIHIEPGNNPPSTIQMKDFCRRFNNAFFHRNQTLNMHLMEPISMPWRVTIEVKSVGINIHQHLLNIAKQTQRGANE